MMRPAPVSPALLLASALLLLLLVSRSADASPSDGPSGGRFARASPLRWGKRSEILRWGKREPLRWGKRSVSDEDYLAAVEEAAEEGHSRLTRAAPLRWGKRSAPSQGSPSSSSSAAAAAAGETPSGGPALLRQMRAASPLRWGKRSGLLEEEEQEEGQQKRAPLRWGKRVPSRFGKRAPSRFGKRLLYGDDEDDRAEDILALNALLNRRESEEEEMEH